MAEWVHYFNLAMATGGFTSALLGLAITLSVPYMKQWERRYLSLMFALLSIYIANDIVEQVTFYFLGPDFVWLARAGVFFELLFSVAIVLSFTAYLLRCANEDLRSSLLFRVAIAIYAAYIAVLVVAQFVDGIFILSFELKCVLPGPYSAALFIPPLALMVLNLAGFLRRKDKLTPRQRIAFVVCNAGPLVSTVVQAALFGVSVLVIGTSISALVMLGFIISDQINAHVRQLVETARRQAQVMALQMRPHFIYNVMSSIYYLCAQDPARAQRVTLDFTDYLRANFEAVAQEDEVPFPKELEHTQAYLAVEQTRLEDGLVVEVDCPHTAFRLPPLTLQPLVENAVKHGADPELPPLHVRITTREEAGFSVVAVEDTGPGIDDVAFRNAPASDASPESSSANPSTALANVRERLAACGGSLEIAPRMSGGTTAIIRIPSASADSASRADKKGAFP
ncbi:MAG: histidine kinase [Eggerthellaceae bacterium]|nr:histidine kinase [Eggerthellaceae bacterium]